MLYWNLNRTLMRLQSKALWLELAPELVEEALIAASREASPSLRQEFLADREAVSGIEIVDIREERFRDFDTHWAERFHIGAPLIELMEKEASALRVSGCILDRARPGCDEHITLRKDSGEGSRLPVLCLTVKADTLLSRDRLRELVELVL